MDVKEIVDVDMQVRIMQMRIDAARSAADYSAKCFLRQVDRANRLAADLARARRQNAELLRRLDMKQGYPIRMLLEG